MKLHLMFVLIALVVSNGSVIAQRKSSRSKPTKAKSIKKAPDLIGLVGEKAPPFTATSVSGETVDHAKLRGKVTVINLWATFCAPCIGEMPDLNKLVAEFQGKDVVFLAASPHNKADSEAFLKTERFDYKILIDSFGMIKDYAPRENPPTPGSFQMLLPAHIVMNKEGVVTFHTWGYSKENISRLREAVLKALSTNS